MGDLACLALDARNRKPFRVDFTVLALVPDLPMPATLLEEFIPNVPVELGIMPSRFKQARVLANNLVGAIAGTCREGMVGAQYCPRRVGDKDCLAGFESRGG